MFTHWHNNPPLPFNPDYIPWASDVRTLTTYQCCLDGVYELPLADRSKIWREVYDKLILLGKPSQNDVKIAENYIYNL